MELKSQAPNHPVAGSSGRWLLIARWTVHVLLFVGLLVFVFVGARARFFSPLCPDEEGFLFDGWLVATGSVPYRDFFEAKPPVIFFANALGLTLFGLKGFLYRIIPTAVAASSIVLLYPAMIRRRIAPWLAALLAAQAALWLLSSDFHDGGLNDSETYGFALTLLGFSLASLSNLFKARSGKVALQLLGGICFGLAVLSKELFVLSVIPAWLLAARLPENGKWDWRRLGFSGLGGLTVGLSFVVYLVANSAFARYWELLRFYRTFAANYCIDIGRFPRVSGMAVIWQSWAMLRQELYNVSHLAFVLALGFALLLLLWRKPKGRWIDLVIALLAVLGGIMAISAGHCLWRHYYLMGTTGLLLLGVVGAQALSDYFSERRVLVPLAVGLLLLGLFVFVGKGPIRTALATTPALDSRPAVDPLLTQTIEQHSKPGEYILLTATPLVYIMMDRKSPLPIAFFLDEILPYDPTLQIDSLRAKLQQRIPRVCYLGGIYYARQGTYRRLLFEPFLAEHHYIKINDQLWYLPDGQN